MLQPALPHIDSSQFANESVQLSARVHGRIVSFTTRNPLDFAPMLRGELGDESTLHAQLFLPRGTDPHPAVIIVPGSGNIGPHHVEQAAALVAAGMAVLLIDPFHGRGIASTVEDQARLTWAASTYDVIAALTYLRTLPQIDANRIGALGSSRGGTAVMLAASEQISGRILTQGSGLKAIVAGYPWCGTQFRVARLADDAALLVLAGDQDNWVSLHQCQDAVHALSQHNEKVSLRVFQGASHAFDRSGVSPTRIENAPTATTFPTIYMDNKGDYIDPRTGRPDPALTPADFLNWSIEGGFVRRGVTVGTRGEQAAEYRQAATDFLVASLSP